MRNLQAIRVLAAAVVLLLSMPSLAAIQLSTVTTSVTSPIFVANAADGSNRLFIVEQGGYIRVLQPGTSTPTLFLDIHTRVIAGGEQGLLGLAFHPQYSINGRFFIYYTRAADGAVVIAEYHVSANPNVADSTELILLAFPHPTFANHNGGMLAFGPDGYLYAGVGDGGSGNDPPSNAQNINVLLGKMLRIDIDHPDSIAGTLYSSPSDNPYVGQAGRHEIHSIGWRNPWRFSFDRLTGQQWVADVGQNAHEEVDTPVVKGGNYGWRVYEGFTCTNNDPALCIPANYIFPIFDYPHLGGRCSITGGYVYRGTRGTLPAGTYVYGDYCTGEILAWDGVNQTLLLDTTMNISAFGEDEQGELYVVDLLGSVSRIVAQTPTTSPTPQSARSRKVHGATTFDLPLTFIAFNPTTEPRSGPSASIVMTFDKAVTGATVTITEGTATAGAPSFNGNDVIVPLANLTSPQYVRVSLSNVTGADGSTGGSGSVRAGFLPGDANGNRNVSLTDLLMVNAVLSQPVTSVNYRRDVNSSGTLTISDLLLVNSMLTRILPAP